MTRQIIFYVVQRMISLETLLVRIAIQDRPNIRTVKDAMIKPVTVHVDRSLNDAVNIMREKESIQYLLSAMMSIYWVI